LYHKYNLSESCIYTSGSSASIAFSLISSVVRNRRSTSCRENKNKCWHFDTRV